MAKHAQNKELMLFCQQCDIVLSLTLAAPISKCFRRPCNIYDLHIYYILAVVSKPGNFNICRKTLFDSTENSLQVSALRQNMYT